MNASEKRGPWRAFGVLFIRDLKNLFINSAWVMFNTVFPLPPSFVYVSKIAATFVFTTVCFGVAVSVLHVRLGVRFGGELFGYVATIVLLLGLLSSALGVMFCCLLRSEELANKVVSPVLQVMTIVGGLFFPRGPFLSSGRSVPDLGAGFVVFARQVGGRSGVSHHLRPPPARTADGTWTSARIRAPDRSRKAARDTSQTRAPIWRGNCYSTPSCCSFPPCSYSSCSSNCSVWTSGFRSPITGCCWVCRAASLRRLDSLWPRL